MGNKHFRGRCKSEDAVMASNACLSGRVWRQVQVGEQQELLVNAAKERITVNNEFGKVPISPTFFMCRQADHQLGCRLIDF